MFLLFFAEDLGKNLVGQIAESRAAGFLILFGSDVKLDKNGIAAFIDGDVPTQNFEKRNPPGSFLNSFDDIGVVKSQNGWC